VPKPHTPRGNPLLGCDMLFRCRSTSLRQPEKRSVPAASMARTILASAAAGSRRSLLVDLCPSMRKPMPFEPPLQFGVRDRFLVSPLGDQPQVVQLFAQFLVCSSGLNRGRFAALFVGQVLQRPLSCLKSYLPAEVCPAATASGVFRLGGHGFASAFDGGQGSVPGQDSAFDACGELVHPC